MRYLKATLLGIPLLIAIVVWGDVTNTLLSMETTVSDWLVVAFAWGAIASLGALYWLVLRRLFRRRPRSRIKAAKMIKPK